MKRLILAGLAVAAAIALVAGCDTFFPNNDDNGGTNGLAEYGGFTTANEAPGFGDPTLVARHPEDTPYNDPLSSSPEVRDAASNGRAKFYMLRLEWGNIDSPDTSEDQGPCPVTDWSGTIRSDGGVLIVRRLIRFEPEDSIWRPMHGSRGIDWISHTRNSYDGILLQIIDVPDPRHKEVSNALTITTPLYTAEIPFDSLPDLNKVVTFDDCNKISLVGQALERGHCPKGFIEGTWTAETDTSGTFAGAWIGDDGALTGLVEGRYGVADSSRVLYGKWIKPSGEFGGLLKGTWGLLADDDGDEDGDSEKDVGAEGDTDEDVPCGYFRGTWADASLSVVGSFHGHFCFPTDPTNGVFRGRWFKDCR